MVIQPILNQSEVASLFSHPLKSFLSTDAPFPHEAHSEELPYHTYNDVPWRYAERGRTIRMHRFLTGREAGGVKPVYGLTASVAILGLVM